MSIVVLPVIWRRWLNNSLANLVGGVATASLNVLLPAMVVRYLEPQLFSVWNLAIQALAYVNLLNLGLQTAVARAVAHASEVEPDSVDNMRAIIRAARSISGGLVCAAIFLVAGLVAGYPLIFTALPLTVLSDMRAALLLFGLSAVSQIMVQVDFGLFQGLHRNAVFVGVQILVRAVTVAAVWVGIRTGQSMVVLAGLLAGSSFLIWPLMRIASAVIVPAARSVRRIPLDKTRRSDLLHYCGTLSVWSVSMLVVNAAGIVIVGRFDYRNVGAYALAMTAATAVVGLLNAALSPLLTMSASLSGTTSGRYRLPRILETVTIGVTTCLGLFFILFTVIHAYVIKFWVGDNFVSSVGPLMVLLVGAHCLRNVGSPYALTLLGAGLQKRALYTALFEAAINVAASIYFGIYWGAYGVAIGSVIGAACGLLGALAVNTKYTPELTPNPTRLVAFCIIFSSIVALITKKFI